MRKIFEEVPLPQSAKQHKKEKGPTLCRVCGPGDGNMLDAIHLQYYLGALVSLIVITNPPSKIPLFVSLTVSMSSEQRRQQANWAAVYAFLVMIVSLIGGNLILRFFGISYGAMRIAGGLVIALIGYQMLFGGQSPNKAPLVRRDKEDYAFFPIAMPGIAGPGTIAVVIGFSTEIAEISSFSEMMAASVMTGAAIFSCSFIHWLTLRSSEYCANHMGPSGMQVLGKIMGFMLICIGVQFVGSGIRTFIAGA